MQSVTIARNIFQAIALAIFVYQMILAVGKYASFSSIPAVETVDVADANLPTMLICPTEYFKLRILVDLEYMHGVKSYLDGDILSEHSTAASWEGNISLPYENLTRLAFESFTQTYFHVEGIPADNWKHLNYGKNIKETFTVLDGYCVMVDIDATNNHLSELFQSEISSHSDFRVYFADPGKSLYYKIDDESTVGDKIKIKKGLDRVYMIEFEETHWMEESGECTNYGTGADFMSLADCVLYEQEQIFLPLLGCMVPWLAPPDYPGSCKGRVPITLDIRHKLYEFILLVTGKIKGLKRTEQFQNCKKPCLEVRALSRRRSSETTTPLQARTVLSFQRRVKVTRYLRDYGLFDLVVEVGSSLGLWIGLSALGIFDLLQQALAATRKLFK